MPRLTPDTLLQRALQPAAEDRKALADAYQPSAPQHAQSLRERDAVLALKGKKLRQLTAEEQDAAFRALVWAEHWEESLADSNPGKKVERDSRRNARLFRELRLACFGKTTYEAAIEESKPVQVWPPSPESIELWKKAKTGDADT